MKPSLLRFAHRVLGLVVVLPMLLLVVTGIPLQFTNALQLGRTGVELTWVHHAYGIVPPERSLRIQDVIQVGDLLIVDQRRLPIEGELCGVLSSEQLIAVVSTAELLIVPKNKQVPVDRTPMQFRVQKCGASNDALVIRNGGQAYTSFDYGVTWKTSTQENVHWFSVERPPVSQQQKEVFGASKLSWERWLQDLHSGRYYGQPGVWVMTLAGFAFIVLGFSGVIMWLRSSRRPR